ncbi:MAG: BatA domain-containing protein, partial [Burkholderiales bacterium]|nr:BatA domain-containing protein [Opitutaceae bacterium]
MNLANPVALWGLLALPTLVAIHFFQQRSRRVETSVLFLIEALSPESQGGRTWERFRGSRSFWLQVLAVLLSVWVLVEPRWPRADSAQTVVVVLDDAMALRAFEQEARLAARDLMLEAERRAAKTEWVLMTSDTRRPALYRGGERLRAEAALLAWRPALGTH